MRAARPRPTATTCRGWRRRSSCAGTRAGRGRRPGRLRVRGAARRRRRGCARSPPRPARVARAAARARRGPSGRGPRSRPAGGLGSRRQRWELPLRDEPGELSPVCSRAPAPPRRRRRPSRDTPSRRPGRSPRSGCPAPCGPRAARARTRRRRTSHRRGSPRARPGAGSRRRSPDRSRARARRARRPPRAPSRRRRRCPEGAAARACRRRARSRPSPPRRSAWRGRARAGSRRSRAACRWCSWRRRGSRAGRRAPRRSHASSPRHGRRDSTRWRTGRARTSWESPRAGDARAPRRATSRSPVSGSGRETTLHLRAERAHRAHARRVRALVDHADEPHAVVAAGLREADARIARRRLHDGRAEVDEAVGERILQHSRRGTVLRAAAGVGSLELGPDVDVRPQQVAVQRDERRVADRAQDAVDGGATVERAREIGRRAHREGFGSGCAASASAAAMRLPAAVRAVRADQSCPSSVSR